MPNIIRVEKTKDYFTASNKPFNNDKLSFGARGILAYLLSKPDDWEIRNKDLYSQSPAGRAAVDRMLRELVNNGYMHRYQDNDDDGLLYWVTIVYEDRRQNPEWDDEKQCLKPKSPNVENRTFGEPNVEKPTVGLSDVGKPNVILSTERNKVLKSTTNVVGGKPPKTEKQKKSQEMFSALTEACQIDLETIRNGTRGKFNQAEKRMRDKGYTPDDVKEFGDWWYLQDWRGKQGQPPTLELIRDCWGQFLRWRKNGKAPRASPNHASDLSSQQLEQIKEFNQ